MMDIEQARRTIAAGESRAKEIDAPIPIPISIDDTSIHLDALDFPRKARM